MKTKFEELIGQQEAALKRKFTDIPNFGTPIDEHDSNFRWSIDEKLGLKTIPELVEIRTRGVDNGVMCAIQLVWEGGIESPVFDCGRDVDPIRSVRLDGSKIRRIISNSHSEHGYADEIRIEHDNGSQQTIFTKGRKSFDEQVREIAANQRIVGLYGRLLVGGNVRYLGFIVADQ